MSNNIPNMYPNLPQGQYPPPQGQYAPPQGQYMPPQGQYPPPQGQYPSTQGQHPPPQGQYQPPQGQYPPPAAGQPHFGFNLSYPGQPSAPPLAQPGVIHSQYYPGLNQAAPTAWNPQQFNQPAKDVIEWIPSTPSTASSLTGRAVVAGHEGYDKSPLWVIRSRTGNDLVPGKFAAKHNAAYVPYNCEEVPVKNIEVLCAPPENVRWVASSSGLIPAGAVPGGNTESGEPLYIGRAKHEGSLTPGKVHPSHKCCYISFGGNEIPHKSYEILCRV